MDTATFQKQFTNIVTVIAAQATDLADTGTDGAVKSAEYLLKSSLEAVANKAAWMIKANRDRIDSAEVMLLKIEEELGLVRGASEMDRQEANIEWAQTQLPAAEAIFDACREAHLAIFGEPMRDVTPGSSRRASSVEERAARLEAIKAKKQRRSEAAPTKSRKRTSK